MRQARCSWPFSDSPETTKRYQMCFYVVLVVRGGDASTIDRLLRRHGRQARPFFNATLAGSLLPDEAPFLTTVGHCDCRTVLAPILVDRERKRAEQAAKLVKRGWSKGKIERWLNDRMKADERAEERQHANTPDSFELWGRVISDLMSTPGVQQAGLLLHFYSGDLEEETIAPLRKMVPASDFGSSLKAIGEDQLLMAA
jgi:ribosomal protein S16